MTTIEVQKVASSNKSVKKGRRAKAVKKEAVPKWKSGTPCYTFYWIEGETSATMAEGVTGALWRGGDITVNITKPEEWKAKVPISHVFPLTESGMADRNREAQRVLKRTELHNGYMQYQASIAVSQVLLTTTDLKQTLPMLDVPALKMVCTVMGVSYKSAIRKKTSETFIASVDDARATMWKDKPTEVRGAISLAKATVDSYEKKFPIANVEDFLSEYMENGSRDPLNIEKDIQELTSVEPPSPVAAKIKKTKKPGAGKKKVAKKSKPTTSEPVTAAG